MKRKKNYLEIIIMVRRKNFGYFNIFKKKFKSWTKKINQSIKKIKPLSQEKLEKYEKAIKYIAIYDVS